MFVGPNNSGKTTAMQALALWDFGAKRWAERIASDSRRSRQRGITINRRDLVALPVPAARLLWRDRHVRTSDIDDDGKRQPKNVRIEIIVEGETDGIDWKCGLEFDYANEESLYCRPLRLPEDGGSARMEFPPQAAQQRVAFLPPMSGLIATETRLDIGAINVRVGDGRTAEVLRNLCYRLFTEQRAAWDELVGQIEALFGATLQPPDYIELRSEITMAYRARGVLLDLSSSGRGMQQTMLILAYMLDNPGAVMLLDEPDAHLEILRQRQTYQLISEVARGNGSQIIAASHSEVLLNEAAGKDTVVAFVGRPHRIDRHVSDVIKSLEGIGFEHYAMAEQTGWVLFLEGPTDLDVLRAFARRLGHAEAMRALERPYTFYVQNQARKVSYHFHGLKEALPHLNGIALFDRFQERAPDTGQAQLLMWQRREIENYLCSEATLLAYAEASVPDATAETPLFLPDEQDRHAGAMTDAIAEVTAALATLGRGSPWSHAAKVSDEFLTPLFGAYYAQLRMRNRMEKRNFHELVAYMPIDEIDPEVTEKLDAIANVAARSTPGDQVGFQT